MPEPHATSAGAGWLFLKLGGAVLLGVLGAALVAGFAPKHATRGQLFLQIAAGGTSSLVFGPAAIRLVDRYLLTWLELHTLPIDEALVWAAPVLLLCGCVGWGVFGAVYKFREILAERAAHKLADAIKLNGAPK